MTNTAAAPRTSTAYAAEATRLEHLLRDLSNKVLGCGDEASPHLPYSCTDATPEQVALLSSVNDLLARAAADLA